MSNALKNRTIIENRHFAPFGAKFYNDNGASITDNGIFYQVSTPSTDYQITRTVDKITLPIGHVVRLTFAFDLRYLQSGTSNLDYQKFGLFSDDPTSATDNPDDAIWLYAGRDLADPDFWFFQTIRDGVADGVISTAFTARPSDNDFRTFRIIIQNFGTQNFTFEEDLGANNFSLTAGTSTPADPTASTNYFIGNVSSSSSASVAVSRLMGYTIDIDSGHSIPMTPKRHFFSIPLKDGATFDFTGDYSGGGAVDAKYTATEPTYLSRLIVYIEDTAGFSAIEYGDMGVVLSTGIIAYIKRSGVAKENINGDIPVISNAGWSHLCFDADFLDYGGGNEALTVRWSFDKSGTPIILNEGDEFGLTLNDNFTQSGGLIHHYFTLQGYTE